MKMYLVYGKDKAGWTKDPKIMWMFFKAMENRLNDLLACTEYLSTNRIREIFEQEHDETDDRMCYFNDGKNFLTIKWSQFKDGDYQLIIEDQYD